MFRVSIGIILSGLVFALPARAEPLRSRAETNLRYGDERSILMTELWAPLVQDDDRVLYGDLRLMGDDQENREGNLGLGYRQIIDLPVLDRGIGGLHGWIDRRMTERGNTFYQVTTGAEWLGDVFDLKANGYIGLTGSKTFGGNGGSSVSDPFFAGTGIFVTRTTGTQFIEETQNGADAEIGFTIPVLTTHIDSIRFYTGGYYFDGPNTENVAGWRGRLAADVTSDIQLGARFQRDDERGSQGFLEATIRFPFGNKKSYREEGLRARLDESPERDIDIVTGTAKKAGGGTLTVPVINVTTDNAQRVLHIDNSRASAGDGSNENPFNSLSLAESAQQAFDILYVHEGTGTSVRQDQGITLSSQGVMLVGSGANFYYDQDRFRIDGAGSPTAFLLAGATTAPVITNTGGNGITIAADDVTVAGVRIDSAQGDGISALADAASLSNIMISNVITTGNRNGIWLQAKNGGNLSASVQNSITTGNDQHGVTVYDDTNGTFDVDLGGGALGSRGRNILAANTMEDLAVDYDGRSLAAQENWWGQAGGPAAGQIYYGAAIDDNLVGHWQLDEASGSTAQDRAGGHDGTLVNNPGRITGIRSGALGMDRSLQQHVRVPDYDAVDTGDKLTISYWVNPDSILPKATHIAKWNADETTLLSSWGIRGGNVFGDEMLIFIADGIDGGDNFFETTDLNLATSTWTNISFVFDGAGATDADRLKVYKDGTLLNGIYHGTIPAALSNTNEDIMFGRTLVNAFSDYFDGGMDDVRIYRKAMTAGELGEVYRSTVDSTVDVSGSLSAAP